MRTYGILLMTIHIHYSTAAAIENYLPVFCGDYFLISLTRQRLVAIPLLCTLTNNKVFRSICIADFTQQITIKSLTFSVMNLRSIYLFLTPINMCIIYVKEFGVTINTLYH